MVQVDHTRWYNGIAFRRLSPAKVTNTTYLFMFCSFRIKFDMNALRNFFHFFIRTIKFTIAAQPARISTQGAYGGSDFPSRFLRDVVKGALVSFWLSVVAQFSIHERRTALAKLSSGADQ